MLKIEKPFWYGLTLGIFVILGLSLLFFLAYLTEGISLWSSHFKLYTHLNQSSGLNRNSLVTLNGVPVGFVHEVAVDENNIHQVKVTIKIENKLLNKIPADSFITLKTQGALGDKYLEITPGKSSETLTEGSLINALPTKDWLDAISQKAQESGSIFETFKTTHEILNQMKESRYLEKLLDQSFKTLKAWEMLAHDLRQTNQQWQQFQTKELIPLTQELSKILVALKGNSSLGRLIYDDEIYRKILSFLGPPATQDLFESSLQQYLLKRQESKSTNHHQKTAPPKSP